MIEMKRILSVLVLVSLFVALLAPLAEATTYPTYGHTRVKTTVRKEPKPKGKKVVDLKADTEVEVNKMETGEDGEIWYKITTAKEKEGYIIGTDLAVEDNDRDEEASSAVYSDVLYLDKTYACEDYNGMGKKYSWICEINGKPVAGRHPKTAIGADAEFTIFTRATNTGKSKATGEAKSLFTPSYEDVLNGFAVQQKLTAVWKEKEVEWVVTYTFLPEGVKKPPVTYEVDNIESFETGTSAAANTVVAGSNSQTEAAAAAAAVAAGGATWTCLNGHAGLLDTWLFCPFCGVSKPVAGQ